MKKFLLSLAAFALSIAPSLAEEVTIDMATIIAEKGWAANEVISEISQDNVTLTFQKGEGSLDPKVLANQKGYYLYSGNTLEVQVPAGNRLESITFTSPSISYYFRATCDLGQIVTTGMKLDYVWEAKDDVTNVVTFTGGSNTSQISKMVITYSEFSGKIPEKAMLSFPEEEYEVTMGDEFEAPALTKATTAPATYTSSNPAAATVDPETGAVTLVAPGKTVITATCEANDDYFGGSASYTLEIKKLQVIATGSHNIVCSVADKKGFTYTGTTYMYGQEITMQDDGIDFTFKRGGYTNIYYYFSNDDLQIPANSTVKVVAPEPYVLRSITFNLSPDGVKFQPALTPSIGEMIPQTVGANKIEWIGEDKEVTFTTGAKAEYSATNASSAGKLCFSSVDVAYDIYTGVNGVETVKGEAKFFDLNGRQVENPANGIYVMIVDGKASKVVIK